MADQPSVAVVIPNWNGVDHLPHCLNSLAQLDFPRDHLEVIVVDNGSTDGSLELLRRDYPWVMCLEVGENLGFAEASNRGAALASSECVAFLNNDIRVDAQWLTNLLAKYDPESQFVCVAGLILNWEGDRIDFIDGWINFHGSADQEYRGVLVDEALIEDGRELPFACGGSMLIKREVFLALRGFDPRYFAFFEDVDLGWRLWLAGYNVRLAANARSFHRGHGTASGVPMHQRCLLWERNALLTLIKNVSDENLASVLAASALLLAARARLLTGSGRNAFVLGSTDRAPDEVVSRSGLAALHAVADVLMDLDAILEERERIQQLRQRSDETIFALFRRPFAPAARDAEYLEASLRLRGALGLDELYARQRVTSVLVIAGGETRRLRTLARNASAFAPVVFASSSPPTRIQGVGITAIRGSKHLAELVSDSDCVLMDGLVDDNGVVSQQTRGLLLVDVARGISAVDPALLRRGDVFFCSSEQHRSDFIRAVRTHSNGDVERRVLVLPDEDGPQKAILREVLREPWRWQRDGDAARKVAIPEDLQLLLRTWREQYTRAARSRHLARAVWRRLPTVVQKMLYRLVWRP